MKDEILVDGVRYIRAPIHEARQAALVQLDRTLCNFTNACSDPWNVDKWRDEVGSLFVDLCRAYDTCHETKLMDIDTWSKPREGDRKRHLDIESMARVIYDRHYNTTIDTPWIDGVKSGPQQVALKTAERLLDMIVPPAIGSDLQVLNKNDWVPCSPQWLTDHPGQCGFAPRVWSESRGNHYHPKNWPIQEEHCLDPRDGAIINADE